MDRLRHFWHEWRGFFLFVALMFVIRSAVADWNQVPSGSMKPNILEGDRVVVNKIAYDLRVPFTFVRIDSWANPSHGEIVTFDSPSDERLFIKRVIGEPGDIIELRSNRLIINGVPATYVPLQPQEVAALPIEKPECFEFFHEQIRGQSRVVMLDPPTAALAPRPAYCTHQRLPGVDNHGPIQVPADNYFMMGDNRDDSGDSRTIGLVARWRILGRAHSIAFSTDAERFYMPRFERFFQSLN